MEYKYYTMNNCSGSYKLELKVRGREPRMKNLFEPKILFPFFFKIIIFL